ncbi:glycosyltransferase family 4 protein [Pedobacter sp. FW305-3-2-15-E-R2A2]|jgi:glycosyltransferase involved in cell wall biosynthesis|uniref:glycosyltransferase family 4 protein n=1 Tax=Pedobacter sp. FW305-3-2-15-E-R2A2 TaxID=3140251 RepID=UPI003140359A
MERKIKKILLVCDSSDSLLDFRGKLIEALLLKNEVIVFSPKIVRQDIRERLLGMGVQLRENDLKPSHVSVLSDLHYLRALYRVIKEIQPDVFFPYAFKPVIYGTLVAKFCRVKRITPMLTGLGYNFSDVNRRKGLVSMITRMLLKYSLRPDPGLRIIFQNKDDRKKLITRGIIGPKHQSYVVNGSGVDLSHYHYTPPRTTPLSFLMISRLINAKGIREFFEAAKLMRQRYPEIRFKLIGAFDPNIDAIGPDLYEKISSGEVIEYYGSVSDVRPFLANASIVVLPSYYGEGVPRSLLEAMAMGRGIITSNSVGCKETVNPATNAVNGFLVPVKDVSALVSSMEYFYKHTTDVVQFGLNGRKFAKEKFEISLINERMLHILQEA